MTVRQTITPTALQGRVHPAMAAFSYGAIPVGAFLGGTLGTFLGQLLGIGPGLAITLLVGSAVGIEAPLWIVGRQMSACPAVTAAATH